MCCMYIYIHVIYSLIIIKGPAAPREVSPQTNPVVRRVRPSSYVRFVCIYIYIYMYTHKHMHIYIYEYYCYYSSFQGLDFGRKEPNIALETSRDHLLL